MKRRNAGAALTAALILTLCLPATAIGGEAVTEGTEGAVSYTETDTEMTREGAAPEDDASTHGITFAKDYREVYEALKRASRGRYVLYNDVMMEDYAVSETADTASAAASGAAVKAADTGAGATDYSTTNLREQGVDEADIVKTDGSYLYILEEGTRLRILRADGADLEQVSLTQIGTQGRELSRRAADLYVDGDLLCVAVQEDAFFYGDADQDWYSAREERTVLCTYDISAREHPRRMGLVRQDGYYKQSRKVGDVVYLYSWLYPNLADSYEESDLIPTAGGTQVQAQQICIPELVTDPAYLIVSSVDLRKPEEMQDTKVLISGADQLYVSQKNLYVMNLDYTGYSDRTEIVKFSCEEGRIEGAAACYLKGYVNDFFSIDEYDGKLRVLTTYTGSERGALLEAISDLLGLGYYDSDRWTRHNALYVLDENLKRLSRLTGIARNEEIRSARYFGETAYFVTFQNTDPLFTADLSDPAHPELVGELKVSGFSSYLHPYGEGKLLGIGYEADEETGAVSGLKLSMFDISDPFNVTEEARYVIRGVTWCPAIEDYKAILADGEKNLIGFFCEDRYLVFSYDEAAGFSRQMLYDFFEDDLGGAAGYDSMRGLYIGSELYLAGGGFAAAFDMEDGFAKGTVLDFR